ncbi:hypothetical protein BEWA_033930 [Theileria equi strain WA]|uniref:Immune mapped protein 2 N-terminal domain-containing protein n=1 Tax=Theileria equi strain WA TaxID=1537102 RepID=L0AZV8_THEEQ|nr:hypothetical protein BEWA_033930 [Theileria equi strain WA]AFZ80536.1 hypothetical protein BEWA_033930 [Theileria equi strain WA]|eukprot:XP_004830202.1 hypothetical protein BEWA_033930 [Theileria equi strain WA]
MDEVDLEPKKDEVQDPGCAEDVLESEEAQVAESPKETPREPSDHEEEEVKVEEVEKKLEALKVEEKEVKPDYKRGESVILKREVSIVTEDYDIMKSDTPVCYLLYEGVDNGSFYLQWKASTGDELPTAVLLCVPTKTVPKFKITADGGKSLFSNKVVPDKMKFYSSICQFMKMAKDYKAKVQLLPGWITILPFKSDLHCHHDDNRVVKVGTEPFDLEGVNHVAIAGKSTSFSIKMTKEQFTANVRNCGYGLAL